ncbi:MAG TPA: 2-oxo acid dehydrogenase subunit E2, partial [Solirubrobacteraceae bacterium]|nr:2-oxo acid dehydrogenase subunit E2 [Solirubrobacteraceae bacterium]
MAVNTTVEVVLPAMGESVTEGTGLEWHKQEGDRVTADETLVEVSTDKVDAEVPAPTAGTLVRIHAAEGDPVSVGAVLAEIQPGGNGRVAAAPDGIGRRATDPTATGEPEAAEAQAPAAPPEEVGDGAGQIVDIVTPGAGESVTEGTVLAWQVRPGDTVEVDQTLVEISTDKVDVELPSPGAGQITELMADEGQTVTVGQVIARLRTGAGAPSAQPPGAPGGADGAVDASPTDGSRGGGEAGPAAARISPVARRMAAAEGVDVSALRGSGPNGRIVKADVAAAAGQDQASVANGASAALPATARTSTAIRGGGAMLARYMDESRSIPTATSLRTLTVTVLEARRGELKAAGLKVSFTHLVAYAIARAAQDDMPVMTHHFEEVDGRPHRVDDGAVHLGIAVDVEKRDGSRTLMVPVVRDAGRLTFSEFLHAFNDLIARARDNKLTADDLSGANISLTNPGGIGTIASVPRLMVGQGTIVATGAIDFPVGLGAIGASIGVEKVMSMTSTYDHRVIQGAESGRFLKVVEDRLQGEHGFYEHVFGDLGVALGPPPPPPQPQAGPTAPAAVPAAEPAVDGRVDEELLQAVQAATSLIKAHRTHGHLAARLDPLGVEPEGDPALDPQPLGLTPELQRRIPARILRIHVPGETLADALPHLHDTYCGTIAYEIEHIASHRQRTWLRQKIESGAFRGPLTEEHQSFLLERLIQVDAFERFMHKAYLGQKQFSTEGLDMTVPMLDELIQLSAAHGAREVIIGMAHRGRLNVLAHNLGRPYDTIFAEF